MNIPKLLKPILQLLLIISFAIYLYSNSFAATFTVVNTNDSGLGSLRQAILDANAVGTDDTIDFVFLPIDPNCSIGVCTITLTTGELVISNSGSLAINGTGAENLIISGNNASRVIRTSNDVDAQINDVQITQGKLTGAVSPFGGGGIRNGNGTLEITNSIITTNDGFPEGGGIFNDNGTLEISSSIINSNTAFNGGGIYNDFGTVRVTDSTIDGNSITGVDAGGIFNNEGTLEVTYSTITNNVALSGGGIRGRGGSINTITNSTISFNTGEQSGGGILVTQSTLTIDNSTISNNIHTRPNTSGGGGVYSASDSVTNITNSTISNNSGNNAGGLLNAGSTVNLKNTIIANSPGGNECSTSTSAITNAENSLIEGGLFCVTGTNINNKSSDPLLGSLADNGGTTKTHLPKFGSPVIDAGDNLLVPIGITNDQRGVDRIIDGNADSSAVTDIGAVEFNPNYLTVTKIADTDDGNCDSDCSLREAVEEANAPLTDDIISFATPLFDSPQTITLSGSELTVNNNGSLAIIGPGVDKLTISGNMSSRIFRINSDSNVVLNSLTIANGMSIDDGGAILSENSCLVLNSVVIRNSLANNGGGIYNLGGSVTLNNSTISNNSATSAGGGIYNDCETLTINSSTIDNNSALLNGGGIEQNGSIATIDNSTISNNTTQADGGGINGAPLKITNSTITKNEAFSGNGGGVIIGSNTAMLRNTIIADNSASANPDVDGTSFSSQGHNLIGDGTGANAFTGSQDQVGTGTSPIDPLLSILGIFGGPTQTHSLLPGSPAIDAGDPNNFPQFDQRGFVRPANGNLTPLTKSDSRRSLLLGFLPDIGAFEALAPTAANVSISGKVLTQKGRAIPRAIVHVTDQDGNIQTARTNMFGYYKFEEIEVGQTLIFNVFSKQYQFTTQIVNLDQSITNLNFIAQDGNEIKSMSLNRK